MGSDRGLQLSPQLTLDGGVTTPELHSQGGNSVERFKAVRGGIRRCVVRRRGRPVESWLVEWPADQPGASRATTVGNRAAYQAWLRSPVPRIEAPTADAVRVVDLFCGCGGLSLGATEALRALGRTTRLWALDFDAAATSVYSANFPFANTVTSDIGSLFDGPLKARATPNERRMQADVAAVDLMVGGPPCQGHSDLNNRTRNRDPRNELYIRMVRAAEVLEPGCVVIENVPGALRDKSRVVDRAIDALQALGYSVSSRVLDLGRLGVPQRRKRLVVVARRGASLALDDIETLYGTGPTTLRWAIGDLISAPAEGPFDSPAESAPVTRQRIDYLFDRSLYELPDSERPPCHADQDHSYSSIYGRLRWENPSQTITRGFYSMCMGRYVHPEKRRTLTAHEAARIQFFPDSFSFRSVTGRNDLACLIGNAVPMRLGYAVTLELFR